MVLIDCPQRWLIVQQLSFTDQSVILEIVEHLRNASQIPDDELLRRVSAFLLTYHAHAELEHALTRDAITVSNHLRVSRMPEVKAGARAALRYLLQEDDFFRDTMPIVGLQDGAYVLSLALHEIAGLTGSFAPSTRFSLGALAGQLRAPLRAPPIRLATFVAIRAIGSRRRRSGWNKARSRSRGLSRHSSRA